MNSNPAVSFLEQGFVCAESVLLAVCREFQIDVDELTIPKIAYGFAGGIGNTGAVCGAVAGAVMALGLVRDRASTIEGALRDLAIAQEFRRRFEAEMETISCRELTGLDLTTQDGLEQLMSSAEAQAACVSAVGVAYRLVVDLLREVERLPEDEAPLRHAG